MSKVENIVKWINGPRISWLGHLERMEEDRMPEKSSRQELEGTVPLESRCALRLRYVDLVDSIQVAVEVCCCFTVSIC
jgi:hypothetical protein